MVSANIEAKIDEAVIVLRKGGVIAYPTDTLYGLGANPFSPTAVARVLEIKGRPAIKGLPLLMAEIENMNLLVCSKPPLAEVLARAFWPGPLTLVLPSAAMVPRGVRSGETVALRVPDHPVPRALARGLGGPIVGTSANVSGGPDPVTAQDVEQTLGRAVDYTLDGGPAYRGLSSTVVDLTGPGPRIARLGALDSDAIEKVLGAPLGHA